MSDVKSKFVVIEKIDLAEGEELMVFVEQVVKVVAEKAKALSKNFHLKGIFNDHVIVRDSGNGKLFKMSLGRNKDAGGVLILDDTQTEVKPVFLDVNTTTKAEGVKCSKCDYVGKGEVGADCPKCGAALVKGEVAEEGDKKDPPDKGEDGEEKKKTEKRDVALSEPEYVDIAKCQEDNLWAGSALDY